MPKKKSARYRAGLKRKQVNRRKRVSKQSRVKSGKRNPRSKK